MPDQTMPLRGKLLAAVVLSDMQDPIQAGIACVDEKGLEWVNGAMFGVCATWLFFTVGELDVDCAKELFMALATVMEESLPPGDGPPDINAYAESLIAQAEEALADA